jgi:hypothetical protein
MKIDGEIKFPTAVFDASGERMVFRIEWPGFQRGFSPIEYTPAEGMSAEGNTKVKKSLRAWDPQKSTPHIRVLAVGAATGTAPFGTPERVVATAQVFSDTRDFILHIPQQDPNGITHYVSRRSGIPGKHSPSAGHMVWSSSLGPLTWTVRKVRDKNMPKAHRSIVLLDAYDRLVAIIKPSEKEKGKPDFQLRLYGSLPEQLVGEIIASFSALAYAIWNYAQLGVPDVGLSLVATGLDVVSTGLEIASIAAI